MPEGSSISSIFEDREFWYRLDVDYRKAEQELEDESQQTDESSDTEEAEENEGTQTIDEALLNLFIRRKKRVIESEYGSVPDFREAVMASDSPRDLLLEIYVQYLWTQNLDGEVFQSEDESLERIESIAEDDRLVRDPVTEEYELLWPGEATIGREVQDGEVHARRYYETTPVVLRKSEEGCEIRGRKQDRKKVVGNLQSDDQLTQQTPDSAEEPIVGRVQNLLAEDNEEFRVVGVDFAESELPESSRLRVKNERPIYRDIETLRSKNLVSFEGISEVDKLYLKDTRHGGKFKVDLTHGVEGVEFELKTNHKLDEQRQRFRDGFTAVTDIEFDTIYEYGAEDEQYLFNRILAERPTAYDNYYSELSDEVQQVLEGEADACGEALLRIGEEEVKVCIPCSRELDISEDECPDCGNSEFSDTVERTALDVNPTSVCTYIQNCIEEITPNHPTGTISNWNVNTRSMNNRRVVETSFALTDMEGERTRSEYQEVDVVPHGNQRRPQTVNDYLLQCVYVTYGESASDDDEGYGRLSLYDLITTDDLKGLVGNALHYAITGVKDRLMQRVGEVRSEASDYYNILDNGGPIHEEKEELKEIYDPRKENYFEKHLFYLLKRLYPQTERWGRIGERESDGVLIIPEEDPSDYFVATYDAKLSLREDGYDLGSEEEDQATRYILTEDERDAIENKTGNTGLSAHVLVSQNFDQSDFSRIAGNVQSNLETFADSSNSTKLVFLDFRAVLDLYDLQDEYWWALRESRIRGPFDGYVIDALKEEQTEDGSSYVHFNRGSVDTIREHLIGRLERYDREQLEHYSN